MLAIVTLKASPPTINVTARTASAASVSFGVNVTDPRYVPGGSEAASPVIDRTAMSVPSGSRMTPEEGVTASHATPAASSTSIDADQVNSGCPTLCSV